MFNFLLFQIKKNYEEQLEDAIKSRFTYRVEFVAGNANVRNQQLNFMIKQRQNPFNEEALEYFKKVLNPSLDLLSKKEEFKKAYRTLENLLKSSVSSFVISRNENNEPHEIQASNIKAAFIGTILEGMDKKTILEKLENINKTQELDNQGYILQQDERTKLEARIKVLDKIEELEKANNLIIQAYTPKITQEDPKFRF
ncbi:hypothetical protein ['Camptotheca acuminata' phytoplasma]|uniref:hypothetical protein n=1 Tax='Camptotheca acuminata' phytoplasma TaxID=3239192 RepID=UPI00351A3654